MTKNTLQILADRAAKDPKRIEEWKLAKRQYEFETSLICFLERYEDMRKELITPIEYRDYYHEFVEKWEPKE